MFFLRKKDKRKFDRAKFSLQAKIRIENVEGINEVYCKNLSEGGMLFDSKASFPISKPCIVEISLPQEQKDLVFKGVILRSEHDQKNDSYETAVSFTNIDEGKAKELLRIKTLYS